MISLSNKSSGASVGTPTESQLQILADQLEETDLDDQDYIINRRTIEMIKTIAADYAAVVDILERALSNREGVAIAWSRS